MPADAPPPIHRINLRSAASGGLVHVVGIGLTFAVQIVVARALGADGFGVFAAIMGLTLIAATGASLGYERAALRVIPTLLSSGRGTAAKPKVDAFVSQAITSTLLAGGIIAFGMLSIIAWASTINAPVSELSGQVGDQVVSPFNDTPSIPYWLGDLWSWGCAALLVPMIALVRVLGGTMRGLGATARALLPDAICRDGTLLLLMFLTAGLGLYSQTGLTPAHIMAFAVAGAGLGLAISIVWVRQVHAEVDSPKTHQNTSKVADLALDHPGPSEVSTADTSLDHPKTWRRLAYVLGATTLTQIALVRLDAILLATVSTTADAGQFQAMATLTNVILLPTVALTIAVAPRFARLHAERRMTDLQKLCDSATLGALVGGGSFAWFLVMFPAQFLLLFGPDFTVAAPHLRVLVGFQAIALVAGLFTPMLAMTGGHHLLFALTLFAVALKCALGGWLYAEGGIESAVWVAGGTTLLLALSATVAVRHRIELDTTAVGAALRKIGAHIPQVRR